MKTKLSYFSLLLFLLYLLPTNVQAQETESKKVKVKVIKIEDGKKTVVEEEFDADEDYDIDEILEEYGIDSEDLDEDADRDVNIIIKKIEEGEFLQDIDIDINGLENLGEEIEYHIQRLTDQIEDNFVKKGFLGIYLEETVENENGEETRSVLVKDVIENTTASEMGLKSGDIIKSINGNTIESSADLFETLKDIEPGSNIDVEYEREGTIESASGELGERTKSFNYSYSCDKGAVKCQPKCLPNCHPGCAPGANKFEWNGDFNPEERAFLGIQPKSMESENGVAIDKVIEKSTAEEIGLLEGDIIKSINESEISTFKSLAEAMKEMKPGDDIKIVYERDGKEFNEKTSVKSMADADYAKPQVYKYRMHHNPQGEMREKMKVKIAIVDITEDDKIEVEEKAIPTKNDLELIDVSFAPNPSNGIFNLKFETGEQGDVNIKVLDQSGREIYLERIENFTGYYTNEIDISKEAEGSYFLVISQNDKYFTKKLVKQ